MEAETAKGLLHANCYALCHLILLLRCLRPLLHLQSQQARFGAADDRSMVSSLLVESITALVEGVNLGLAILLLVTVLGQAV